MLGIYYDIIIICACVLCVCGTIIRVYEHVLVVTVIEIHRNTAKA